VAWVAGGVRGRDLGMRRHPIATVQSLVSVA